MNLIPRCNWLPKQAMWTFLARSGLPAASRKKIFPESDIINRLLTKLVRSRWLDIALVLIFVFMRLNSRKELGLISSHLDRTLGQ